MEDKNIIKVIVSLIPGEQTEIYCNSIKRDPIVDGNIEGMQFVVATPENCFTDREIPEFQITAGAACVLALR